MKQFLLTLLMTFAFGICSAQTEHMKFMGIPMEGTLQSFTDKLVAKGFTPMGVQDGISVLTGEFAGYKDCSILVVTDKQRLICKVCVLFPAKDKWGELESCYLNFKSMLTEKYGVPNVCEEKFQSKYVNDDQSKMLELIMDRCKYYSVFDGLNGDIQLEIKHSDDCFVMISYFDNVNQDKLRKRIMDDL